MKKHFLLLIALTSIVCAAWGTATNYHDFVAKGDTIIDLEGYESSSGLSDKFAVVNNTDWASVSTSSTSANVYRTDPTTGKVATNETTVYGTRIGSSTLYKSVFKVMGVTNVKFYVGGKSSRNAYLDIASSDGTINITKAATSTALSYTTDVISYSLDENTSYTLTLYSNSTLIGEVFCYAVKFTVAHNKCKKPEHPLVMTSNAAAKVYAGDVITFSTTGGHEAPITIAGKAGETITDSTWIAVKGIHTFVASQDSVNGYCEGFSELSYNVTASTPVPSAIIEGKASSIVGKTIVLTCVAEDATDYQWYKNGIAIEGATDSKYSFTPDVEGDVIFTCEASNEFNVTPVLSNEHLVSVIFDTQIVTITAKPDKSALHMAIGDANMENVKYLTINGTINSYDLMIMRNKMINLRELDLTNASIEANPYEYYTGYCSHADTLLANSFVNLTSLKLPLTLKYVTSVNTSNYLEINGGVVGSSVSAQNVVINEGVTDIQASAFQGNGTLEQITINAPLTEIHDNSFRKCTNLQEILLPSTIETIGYRAFASTALNQVTIPANVRTIGREAFSPEINLTGIYRYTYYHDGISEKSLGESNFSSLSKLYFESKSQLQNIGEWAFHNCLIDTLVIPDSVQTIGEFAFFGCRYLEYVYFSDESRLQVLNTGVFQNCSGLNSVQLPSSLQTIGNVAFLIGGSYGGPGYGLNDRSYNNTSMDVIIPKSVTSIGMGAFYGRSQLKSVIFPDHLKSIDPYAFSGCSSLDSLSFPTSLQTIGDYAFSGCSGLKQIRVPSTLLEIGDYAFSNCNDVTKVYTYTVEPVAIDQNTFSCWHNADLYVPTTSYYTYFYNTQWSQFLTLKEFDEEYEYFYLNNDYELDDETGAVSGEPDVDLNPGSGLIISGDTIEQNAGTITIGTDENGAASILACSDNLNADTLVINLVLKKGQWSYFCFPFDILLEQIYYAHQYVIREYSGANRAQYGSGGWVNLIGDMIHKGIGYIFQGAQTDTITFRIPNPQIECEEYVRQIQAFNSANNVNANWNFIGNPYPSWYDLDGLFNLGFSSPIYIWNGLDYQVYTPGDDEYHMHPYEGFFTQNPSTQGMDVHWHSDGRETQTQAHDKQGGHGHHMTPRKAARRARQAAEHRQLINLELASEDYTDRTRIVFNEAATMDYELGRDAVFMNGGNAPLHIWSIAPDNSHLSINERPYATGQVDLGYYVREAGFYTLSATRMDTAVIIYDNELEQEVDLSQGDYVFTSGAGTNNTRFSIVGAKKTENHTTGIEDAVVDMNERVNVYNLLGIRVLENVRRSDIHLGAGIYIVENKEGACAELKVD